MAEISAAMVKELREKTGAGMMDCKKALSESGGDVEKAVNWLREKGLSAAAKKGGRVAAEGLVDVYSEGKLAAMVEVNCETDFVAKNPDFRQFVNDLAAHVAQKNPATVEALKAQPWKSGGTVGDALTEKIAKIGENMNIRRFVRVESAGTVGTYIHGGGTIGVLAELVFDDASKAGSDTAKALAKDLAMHAAAAAPMFLKREEADQKVLENERSIYREKAKQEGKPDKILDKIVEGQLQKFLAENCLLEQAFVKDPDITVQKLLEKVGKEMGTKVTVQSMQRFKVGEGIEKKADDFAAEVARMAGT
jgi:elongation factor Ts